MSWRTRFRRRESVIEGLWAIPILGALLGVVLGSAVSIADERLTPPLLWQYSPSTASAVLTSIVGAAASLTGFVVTVTVLVVRMATGTYSARIMRLWFRDRLLKATLAILVGTLTFSFSVLSLIGDEFVPNVGVTLAGGVDLPERADLHRLLRSLRSPAQAGSRRRGCRAHGVHDVRADGAARRPGGYPMGVLVDARGSDARRGRESWRRHPGHRRRRPGRVGPSAWRRTRPAASGRRLRARRRTGRAGLRRRLR